MMLTTELDQSNKKFCEASIAYENMIQTYSSLSKDFIKLKEKEAEVFEMYVKATQEKEKILIDSQMEYSHLKIKIKLLEQVLTKRNEEYNELLKKENTSVLLYII